MRHIILFTLCLVTVLAFGLGLSSCAKKNTAAPQVENTLRLTGSDTMVHLTTDWAEAFMKQNPQHHVAVNGGGSGNGIAALINGSTDIAPSSRDLKPAELKQAKSKHIKISVHPVALDAIAIVVNPENPIESISQEELDAIYTGKITSWKDLGGPDKPIILFSRESSSGTYEFFQEHVLHKKDYAPQARLIPSTIAIIETVAQDDWSIGYVGLGFALQSKDKVKILAVKGDQQKTPVFPNTKSVLSGQYSIARELYLFTPQSLSAQGTQFLSFCNSPQGQALIEKAGFLPLSPQRRKAGNARKTGGIKS